MKKILIICIAVLLAGCGNTEKQLREYVKRHGLSVTCYQDYGWPTVKLQ